MSAASCAGQASVSCLSNSRDNPSRRHLQTMLGSECAWLDQCGNMYSMETQNTQICQRLYGLQSPVSHVSATSPCPYRLVGPLPWCLSMTRTGESESEALRYVAKSRSLGPGGSGGCRFHFSLSIAFQVCVQPVCAIIDGGPNTTKVDRGAPFR